MGGGHGGYHNEPMQYPNQELNTLEPLPHQPMQANPQPIEMQQNYQNQSAEELNKNEMNKCLDYSKRFEECMKSNFNNTSICSQAFEDLMKCQKKI